MHGGNPGGRRLLSGGPVEFENRLAQRVVEHLNIAPLQAAAQPQSQRLDESFLGGKPLGKKRHRLGLVPPYLMLLRSQYALREAWPMAIHCASKALNPGDIRANANDHGSVPTAAVMNMVVMRVIVGVQCRHEPGFLPRDDQPLHFSDGVFHTHKQRAGDNRVADIQLVDAR